MASTISMFESTLRKNGQRACISASELARVLADAGEPGLDRGAEAVPAGQHQAALAPAEHPRDRAQVLDARRLRARRGPAADVQARRSPRSASPRGSRRRSRASRRRGRDTRERVRRQRVHRTVVRLAPGPIARCRASARLERRGDDGLEVAPPELRIGVLARDDLALLGEADAAVDAARRLREDRVVRRTAAAADRAAAAVEEAQLDAAAVGEGCDERALALVQRPVRREVAAVLVAVGVAEHHLLQVAARREPAAVARDGERRSHHRVAAARGRRWSRTAARC